MNVIGGLEALQEARRVPFGYGGVLQGLPVIFSFTTIVAGAISKFKTTVTINVLIQPEKAFRLTWFKTVFLFHSFYLMI